MYITKQQAKLQVIIGDAYGYQKKVSEIDPSRKTGTINTVCIISIPFGNYFEI